AEKKSLLQMLPLPDLAAHKKAAPARAARPAAEMIPVTVRGECEPAAIKLRRKAVDAILFTAGTTLRIEATGPGRLTLSAQLLRPPASRPVEPVTLLVSVDGRPRPN